MKSSITDHRYSTWSVLSVLQASHLNRWGRGLFLCSYSVNSLILLRKWKYLSSHKQLLSNWWQNVLFTAHSNEQFYLQKYFSNFHFQAFPNISPFTEKVRLGVRSTPLRRMDFSGAPRQPGVLRCDDTSQSVLRGRIAQWHMSDARLQVTQRSRDLRPEGRTHFMSADVQMCTKQTHTHRRDPCALSNFVGWKLLSKHTHKQQSY